MSLILKGIDPKTDYGLCILTIKGELITANGKHIQAIQIPKGHGRIIDEDEIIMCGEDWKKYRGMFDEIPTILEAEE